MENPGTTTDGHGQKVLVRGTTVNRRTTTDSDGREPRAGKTRASPVSVEAEWGAVPSREVSVTTPDQHQPNHPAERRVFMAIPDAWEAMTALLDAPARDVPGLRELMSTPTVLDG